MHQSVVIRTGEALAIEMCTHSTTGTNSEEKEMSEDAQKVLFYKHAGSDGKLQESEIKEFLNEIHANQAKFSAEDEELAREIWAGRWERDLQGVSWAVLKSLLEQRANPPSVVGLCPGR